MDKIADKKSAINSIKNPGKASQPLPKADETTKPVLFLSRHGESEYNVKRLFCGVHDAPLTKNGVEDAKKQAELLKDKEIDVGITNDLQRSRITLDEILKNHPDAKLEVEPLLRERDYGELTHQSKEEWMEKDPELTLKYRRSWDFPPPEGESLKMVWENRMKPFCEKLEKRMQEENINVMICCTNNTMRLIRMYFEELTIEETLKLENPFDDYASYNV